MIGPNRTATQRAASRGNGLTGGPARRPRGHAAGELRRIRKRARMMGEASLEHCVSFLRRVLDGGYPNATIADRVRAAENLCDRFGFPKQQQTTMQVGELPTKLIEMSGWDEPPDPSVPVPEPNGHDTTAH